MRAAKFLFATLTALFAGCGVDQERAVEFSLTSDESESFGYRLTVSDVLAVKGGVTTLAAKVETRDPFRIDIVGVRVEFAVNGRLVGSGVTDGDGTAYVRALAPEAAGKSAIRATYGRSSGEGRLFTQSPDVRFFVTDIDNTISDLDEALVVTTPNSEIPAVEGSTRALQKFADTRGVIYLTARDDYLLDKTRGWLSLRGFPEGATVVNDWRLGGPSQGEYKERVLSALKSDFPNIEAGAGENLHDASAYLASGMRAYLIGKSLAGAITVSGWRDIEALEL